MEQAHSTELFSLSIDPITKAHLAETAKWAKFLAIVGFVFLALMVVFGIFYSMFMTSMVNRTDTGYGGTPGLGGNLGAGAITVFFLIYDVIVFFPLFYLLKFANKMKASLAGNDQQALNYSFQNLKACFRYVGILTIITLALYALAIVMGIVGYTAFVNR